MKKPNRPLFSHFFFSPTSLYPKLAETNDSQFNKMKMVKTVMTTLYVCWLLTFPFVIILRTIRGIFFIKNKIRCHFYTSYKHGIKIVLSIHTRVLYQPCNSHRTHFTKSSVVWQMLIQLGVLGPSKRQYACANKGRRINTCESALGAFHNN